MFTVIHLPNLPKVPEHLIQVDRNLDFGVHTNDATRTVTKNGVSYSIGKYSRQPLNTDLENWLKNNIISTWANAGYGRNLGPCMGPHVERTRFYALQYVIDPGGSNVQTVFYRPKANNIEMVPTYMYVNNYDDLTPIDVQVFPTNGWALLNGMTLHSVENIETMRTTIQIGLLINPLDMILKLS